MSFVSISGPILNTHCQLAHLKSLYDVLWGLYNDFSGVYSDFTYFHWEKYTTNVIFLY